MCLMSLESEPDQASREDDTKWPQKNKDGRQELEIRLGGEHISFEVSHHYDIPTTMLRIKKLTRPKDRQDWITGGRQRVGGPGRSASLLLLGTGPEGPRLFADISALQGVSTASDC